MVKAQRFLFSFPKFMDYLEDNRVTLNLLHYRRQDSFSTETIFHLDDNLHIIKEDIHGKTHQYFLIDNDMVIAYAGSFSRNLYIYYLVNPNNDRDIKLIRDMENPFADESLCPIKYNVFKLIKEHGETDR